jgi:hypothetical protein
MKKRSAFMATWIALSLSAAGAQAAQWARVIDDQVDFYDGPTRKHHSLRKLSKGTMLQASNYPTEGYYKVRLQDGTIGWIKGAVLLLKGTPGGPGSAAEGYNGTGVKATRQKSKGSGHAAEDDESSSLDLPPPIPEN